MGEKGGCLIISRVLTTDQNTEGEKMLAVSKTNKGLISGIHKKFLRVRKKTATPIET